MEIQANIPTVFETDHQIKEVSENLNFVNSILPVYYAESAKLPYHINILELIHANENAHSRILTYLLNQNSGEQFEIYNSLITDLLKIEAIEKHLKEKPAITYEKDRIDVLILAKSYAVIIENKIHGAVDQPSQLANYIDKVKQKDYKEERIYVIYLTRDESKKTDELSWVNRQGINYKDSFKERFYPISYREEILPWLRDYILPNCRFKDIFLRSTLEQYIDYLEGVFTIRQTNKAMNEKITKQIKELLQLNDQPDKNLKIVKQKRDEVVKMADQLENMVTQMKTECWQHWLRNLSMDFGKYGEPFASNYQNGSYKERTIGVKLQFHSIPFVIGIESEEGGVFYGVKRFNDNEELKPEISDFLSNFFSGDGKTLAWYVWKWTTYENAYQDLANLIKLIESKIADDSTC